MSVLTTLRNPETAPSSAGIEPQSFYGGLHFFEATAICPAKSRRHGCNAHVETGQVRKVLGDSIGYVGSPTWSPDGSRIAGVYRRTNYGVKPPISGIFAISPDGRARLGHKPDFADDAERGHLPDEHTLVTARVIRQYHEGRRDPSYIPTWYSYGTASPRWVLGTFSGLSWSPDGQTLAFSANLAEDGYFHVYTVSVEGGPARMLKETASAWPQAVDWSQQ